LLEALEAGLQVLPREDSRLRLQAISLRIVDCESNLFIALLFLEVEEVEVLPEEVGVLLLLEVHQLFRLKTKGD
jgi:hypothetical protein